MEAKSRKMLIPLVVLLIVLVAAVLVVLLVFLRPKQEAAEGTVIAGTRIGYAEGATAIDEASLQKAVDEMVAKSEQPGITISYQNTAASTDGRNFVCTIANAEENEYDMFIAIYADAAMTDELFLSELLRPGTGFNKIALNRRLEVGEHRVYVAFTQIEELNGEQVIHGQSVVTMDFVVLEE